MDDTLPQDNINLDPSMIVTQNVPPLVSAPIIQPKIIDITPGAPQTQLPNSSSVHIDVAQTPSSRIIDITPTFTEAPVVSSPVAASITPPTPVVVNPIVQTPVVQSPNIVSTGEFKIDTTSPLFEDPDKVVLVK